MKKRREDMRVATTGPREQQEKRAMTYDERLRAPRPSWWTKPVPRRITEA